MPDTSDRDSGTGNERDGHGGHTALLRSPTPQCHERIQSWFRAAVSRGDKVVTVAVPPDLHLGVPAEDGTDADGGIDSGGLPALPPAQLHRESRPARLIDRTLGEGYRGLGLLIWADGVIAAASPQEHAALETSLAQLCREHPVSVLCLYDRDAAGTQQLDMAITYHPDELRDQQAFVHHDRRHLTLGGDFDITNIDVLNTALRTLTDLDVTRSPLDAIPTLHIDLQQLRFLGVAAARTLDIGTAIYRRDGGCVELHNPNADLIRVLQILNLHRLPGLTLHTAATGR